MYIDRQYSACKWDENGQTYVLPCQGARDETVGRSHWETDDENRDRLGHPRSPKICICTCADMCYGGSMYSRANVNQ